MIAPVQRQTELIFSNSISFYLTNFSFNFRYRNIVKKLIMCYDQMVQTQKRDLIKKVLDCAIGRMLEYKREIVRRDYSDYQ